MVDVVLGNGEEARVHDRVIVVAGPSAAGKSSFIGQLRNGTLGGDIRSLLPDDAAMWPDIRETAIAERVAGESVLVHYNVLEIERSGFRAELDDPSIQSLMRASALTIVNIAPDYDRLLQQYLARKERMHKASLQFQCRKSWPRRAYGSFFREPAFKVLAWAGVKKRRNRRLHFYPAIVDRCVGAWFDLIGQIARSHPNFTVIDIVPIGSPYAIPEFRLQPFARRLPVRSKNSRWFYRTGWLQVLAGCGLMP